MIEATDSIAVAYISPFEVLSVYVAGLPVYSQGPTRGKAASAIVRTLRAYRWERTVSLMAVPAGTRG